MSRRKITDFQVNPAQIYVDDNFTLRFKIETIEGLTYQHLKDNYTYNSLKNKTYNEILGG